jgi:hypothetical protein
MSCHSEEIWESFDALGRRVQQLSHIVREMQARIDAIEHNEEPVSEAECLKRFANFSQEEVSK